MKMHRVGSFAQETADTRLEASHLGSLGAHLNQGGSYSHPSGNTLPELLDQGRSTKRTTDGMKTRGLKGLMDQ